MGVIITAIILSIQSKLDSKNKTTYSSYDTDQMIDISGTAMTWPFALIVVVIIGMLYIPGLLGNFIANIIIGNNKGE